MLLLPMRWSLALLSLAGVLAMSARSEAQGIGVAAAADVVAGIEGGGSGYASGVRRTRTTLRLGADLWIDEYPNNILAIAMLIEVEPVATFGAEARYQRRVEDFMFHAGFTAVIARDHMIGATAGAAYRIHLSEMFEINVGPTFNIYFTGADLPDDRVLWQGVLGAGLRVTF